MEGIIGYMIPGCFAVVGLTIALGINYRLALIHNLQKWIKEYSEYGRPISERDSELEVLAKFTSPLDHFTILPNLNDYPDLKKSEKISNGVRELRNLNIIILVATFVLVAFVSLLLYLL